MSKTRKMLFADDIPGGAIIRCEICGCVIDIRWDDNVTEVLCPSCKSNLAYPERASW